VSASGSLKPPPSGIGVAPARQTSVAPPAVSGSQRSPVGQGTLVEHSCRSLPQLPVRHWVVPVSPFAPSVIEAQQKAPVGHESAPHAAETPEVHALWASHVAAAPPPPGPTPPPPAPQQTSGGSQTLALAPVPHTNGLPVTGAPPLLLPLPLPLLLLLLLLAPPLLPLLAPPLLLPLLLAAPLLAPPLLLPLLAPPLLEPPSPPPTGFALVPPHAQMTKALLATKRPRALACAMTGLLHSKSA
jgi:hypothetical protein